MLETVEHGPPTANASVVWLHGLGADGHDFVPIVPLLDLSGTRFVFPHAERRPVTINGGFVMRAWYDILTMAPGPGRERADHIRQSATEIAALVARERDRGAKKVVLMGFSQGAAMALHVGVRADTPLTGIGVLSGYLVLADTVSKEAHAANKDTPILFCHGSHDDVVPLARGEEAYQAMQERPCVEWNQYRMGHEVVPDEIATIKRWLHSVLS